jgi:hypothetical protein
MRNIVLRKRGPIVGYSSRKNKAPDSKSGNADNIPACNLNIPSFLFLIIIAV